MTNFIQTELRSFFLGEIYFASTNKMQKSRPYAEMKQQNCFVCIKYTWEVCLNFKTETYIHIFIICSFPSCLLQGYKVKKKKNVFHLNNSEVDLQRILTKHGLFMHNYFIHKNKCCNFKEKIKDTQICCIYVDFVDKFLISL